MAVVAAAWLLPSLPGGLWEADDAGDGGLTVDTSEEEMVSFSKESVERGEGSGGVVVRSEFVVLEMVTSGDGVWRDDGVEEASQ